jgi:hypothetical protein
MIFVFGLWLWIHQAGDTNKTGNHIPETFYFAKNSN